MNEAAVERRLHVAVPSFELLAPGRPIRQALYVEPTMLVTRILDLRPKP